MPAIIVVARPSDFMAHLEGQPEKYECAANPFAAIGMLLVTRQKELGLTVQFPESAPPALREAAKR